MASMCGGQLKIEEIDKRLILWENVCMWEIA